MRYPTAAIAIHWLHAALIVTLLVIGWNMVDLPKGPERSAAIALHKSLGICALLLWGVRIVIRRAFPPPAMPDHLPATIRKLAAGVHHALYATLILVPLAGYLSASFTKYPMKFFGIELPRIGWPDESLNALFNGTHKVLVLTLMLLLTLHVAGALLHAVKRDGIVSRMLPSFREDSEHQ